MAPPTGTLTLIAGARVLRPDGQFGDETVVLRAERILALESETPGAMLLNHDDVKVISAEGALLTPGLIDLHVNGAFGCDFNRASMADIQRALGRLPARGITSVVPTVITAPIMDMLTAINTLEEVIHHGQAPSCRVIGLHLEGPYLSPAYRGAHPADAIATTMAIDELRALTSPHVAIMTLAPERDPQGLKIQYLAEKGIRVNAGHTNATAAEMTHAIAQGVRGVTHLYNAMRPFHHREPGVIGPALAHPDVYVELIADGIHVHPAALQLAMRAKGTHRVMLVSDAMALAGDQPEGAQCVFANALATLHHGEARHADGTLAGSARLLDECLRFLCHARVVSFEQALAMASTTPANYLGRGHELGQIAPGYLADLVLWDPDTLTPKATWIGGKLVYQAETPITPPAPTPAVS